MPGGPGRIALAPAVRILIRLNDVTKRYPDGTVAVGNLTLEIPSREITVLLGSSGCGKTTTLRMINRLIEPTSGTIELDGRDLGAMPVHELRRGIGYVIQQAGLFPHRTVADNIATVPKLLGWDKERQRKRSLELIELVGLDPGMADRYPSQLSGGQQQRVGVARALAADPPVLLMDEPFGAVDPVRRGALQQEFKRLQRELGKTVVFVTHDVDEAVLLGDRIAIMREGGRVAQYGPPEVLLAHPADEFVASFIGGTRGLKLLSLRPAADVPVTEVGPDGLAGWALEVDDVGRPTVWRALAGSGPDTPVEPVGPGGSIRDLLDSAVASPPRAGVRVDGEGGLLGAVPFAVLEEYIPAPQDAAAEAQEAV
jgi:osmoprotectant transport system ATP-binding protein